MGFSCNKKNRSSGCYVLIVFLFFGIFHVSQSSKETEATGQLEWGATTRTIFGDNGTVITITSSWYKQIKFKRPLGKMLNFQIGTFKELTKHGCKEKCNDDPSECIKYMHVPQSASS